MPTPLQIRFGTDGWRGVIARDFTFEGVRLVAGAVAATLRTSYPEGHRFLVAVGHDTRFLSRRFAQTTADVLSALGVDAYLTPSHVPTPMLACAIPILQARGGLMVTASHNPPYYNGLKVRTADGGAATATLTDQIEAEVRRLSGDLDGWTGGALPAMDQTSAGAIDLFDPFPLYQERLRTLIDMERIGRSRFHVVIDPMYGATQGIVAGLLRRIGLQVEEIHSEINPWFGGVSPEPLGASLGELAERVKGLNGPRKIGLAFDGDGDRLGAIDETGSYVTPHQVFALLLQHLVARRGLTGTVIKTVSTTTMIDRLAASHGLRLAVTPIGFKHIAEVMRGERFLIGGEESGGIGVSGHIPERDGIASALLLLECLATEEKPLGVLLRELEAKVGPHCYRRLDLQLARQEDGRELGRRFREDPPAHIDGWRVKEVQALDGVKLVGADGGWLLIRPSGTEPVLRLYAEAQTQGQVSRLLDWAKTYADRIQREGSV
ncbi:MAG: phosphoglucomutase/phosphomannomutase family protein [candidate division NC10 bacterium]|nr:phosphoglucomutase/phosphomannomutase family protein [candidate division NC10 bacterium]MDE2320461.1 phosphoglucomutase/phosphomannomutase family protein [candidate division NC10 bacterium]